MSKISGEKPQLTEEELLRLLAAVRAPPVPKVPKKDDAPAKKLDSPEKVKKQPLPVVGEKVEEELVFINGGEETPPKVVPSKPKEPTELKSSAAAKKQAAEDFNNNLLQNTNKGALATSQAVHSAGSSTHTMPLREEKTADAKRGTLINLLTKNALS